MKAAIIGLCFAAVAAPALVLASWTVVPLPGGGFLVIPDKPKPAIRSRADLTPQQRASSDAYRGVLGDLVRRANHPIRAAQREWDEKYIMAEREAAQWLLEGPGAPRLDTHGHLSMRELVEMRIGPRPIAPWENAAREPR